MVNPLIESSPVEFFQRIGGGVTPGSIEGGFSLVRSLSKTGFGFFGSIEGGFSPSSIEGDARGGVCFVKKEQQRIAVKRL